MVMHFWRRLQAGAANRLGRGLRGSFPGVRSARLRAAGVALFGAASLMAAGGSAVHAQDYPDRPVHLIVPTAPGGGADIIGRHIAQRLTTLLGQPVVVENRAGAGSILGTTYVANAAPDGYTLLIGGLFNMVMNSALNKNLSYDPLRDLVVVDYISAYPFTFMVRKGIPVKTLAEFVAYAKERPGKLNYASAGSGSVQHVWGTILLKSMGLDLIHVPHRGTSPAYQDMLGERVDVMFDNLSSAKSFVQSDKVTALAVSSAERSKALPDVPTINETGVVKFEGESWFGVIAPANTPAPVLERLRKEMRTITSDPEFAAVIERDAGRILAIPPAEGASWLANEVNRWIDLVSKYEVSAQ